MSCPGENELVEYVEGLLPTAMRGRMETHLDKCQLCRRIVANVIQAAYPRTSSDLRPKHKIPRITE